MQLRGRAAPYFRNAGTALVQAGIALPAYERQARVVTAASGWWNSRFHQPNESESNRQTWRLRFLSLVTRPAAFYDRLMKLKRPLRLVVVWDVLPLRVDEVIVVFLPIFCRLVNVVVNFPAREVVVSVELPILFFVVMLVPRFPERITIRLPIVLFS